MKITFWRIDPEDSIFRVQFNLKERIKTQIVQMMRSLWILTGEGSGPNGEVILIFQRNFVNEQSFNLWRKSFPYPMEEIIEKRVCRECGSSSHTFRNCSELKKDKVVICNLCGFMGHTKFNCPHVENGTLEDLTANDKFSNTKKLVRKSKRCSICGAIGHNARTCNKK